ncbi:MAG: hypothetical protein ACLQM6_14170 [Acidobacteriaceae bacterium]
MIKKVIFTFLQLVLQFFLFFVAFFAGIFLPLFRVPSMITRWANGTRGFQWDGVVLMLALLALILLIEALCKRFRSAAPWSALAFLLALIAGLVKGFGSMSFDQ